MAPEQGCIVNDNKSNLPRFSASTSCSRNGPARTEASTNKYGAAHHEIIRLSNVQAIAGILVALWIAEKPHASRALCLSHIPLSIGHLR